LTYAAYKMTVDRRKTAREALSESTRVKSINFILVDSMPLIKGAGLEEVYLVFFKPKGILGPGDVEKEREWRGLKKDMLAQIQFNTEKPEFARRRPNGDCWERYANSWCSMFFHSHQNHASLPVGKGHKGQEDCVNVYEGAVFDEHTWFCGIR